MYATDRKNTKVEFPEARIYEETLNCLLYENRTGPDQDLMQVLLKESNLIRIELPYVHFVKHRRQAHEGLAPLTPQTTRMNAIGLVGKGVLEVELLLVLRGQEVIAQAWLGSEATRTPEGFRWLNLKNTPNVNMHGSVWAFKSRLEPSSTDETLFSDHG